MRTKQNTYKSITLQFVLSVLVLSVSVKPNIQLISSFSFNKNKIELNENIDYEDEVGTELDEAIFNSKPLGFQSQVLVQKKIKFDNYSSQILTIYPDIFLPPPIIFY